MFCGLACRCNVAHVVTSNENIRELFTIRCTCAFGQLLVLVKVCRLEHHVEITVHADEIACVDHSVVKLDNDALILDSREKVTRTLLATPTVLSLSHQKLLRINYLKNFL